MYLNTIVASSAQRSARRYPGPPPNGLRIVSNRSAKAFRRESTALLRLALSLSQVPLERPEIGHLLRDSLEVSRAEGRHPFAWQPTCASKAKDLACLVEREAKTLRASNEREFVQNAVGIDAITGTASSGPGDEFFVLVESNRVRRYSRPTGDLTNEHMPSLRRA